MIAIFILLEEIPSSKSFQVLIWSGDFPICKGV